MLNRGWGSDPASAGVFAGLYPPRRPNTPSIAGVSTPTSEPPEAHFAPPQVPDYTDLLRAEAMANPQMEAWKVSPGLAIGHPELNENTLL